MILDDLAEPIN